MRMSDYVKPIMGLCNKVIQLDGDRFWLTVPHAELLYDVPYRYFTHSKLEEGHFPEITYAMRDRSLLDILTVPTEDTTVLRRINTETQHSMMGENNEKLYGFRPMLVPLDKDFQPELNFERQDENMLVTSGGFLVVTDGDPAKDPFAMGGKHPFSTMPGIYRPCQDITIMSNYPANSEVWHNQTEPLSWVHIHGCLICTKVICAIEYPLIKQCNLIPNTWTTN